MLKQVFFLRRRRSLFSYQVSPDETKTIDQRVCSLNQGDVVAILNSNNTVVAEYVYDVYGNILSVTDGNGNAVAYGADHIANINPIRYRGYYYDTETMFYYLQSRYYDPYLGRFINADGYMTTGQGFLGYNMYAYCGNNPVIYVDYSGNCHGYPDDPNLNSSFSGVEWGYDCGLYGWHARYPKPEKIEPTSKFADGKGYVYIIKEEQLNDFNELEKNVIVIVDKRTNTTDPNMQVQNSYRITKTRYQKEIVQIMLDYNELNPVTPAWSRTTDSMIKEWKIHNLAYAFGYKQERTGDCDFNNADEGLGLWDFIGR